MPRWPEGHVSKRTCPSCGGRKDFDSLACRRCSVPAKPLAGRISADHPAWRGGYRIDRDGYVRTYAPEHPWPRRTSYVLEHVRIMELHIGRRLSAGEVVHHRDHDKRNNDISNLDLMSADEHSSMHRKADAHRRKRVGGRFA